VGVELQRSIQVSKRDVGEGRDRLGENGRKVSFYPTHCVPVIALMFLHIFIMCSSDWITFGPAIKKNGVAAFSSLKNSDSCSQHGLFRFCERCTRCDQKLSRFGLGSTYLHHF
jgi:hypothetical protein